MLEADVARCHAYFVGHNIHPIQARLSWESGSGKPVTVTVEPNGWITCQRHDGSTTQRWTHDPARLARLIGTGPECVLREHSVLGVATSDRTIALVSVSSEETPCTTASASGATLAELVIEQGGFLVTFEQDSNDRD